jgi:CheY-like chemotaxis protein
MENFQQKLEKIKEEGKILTSIEFSSLGEMSGHERRREITKKIVNFTHRTLDYENIALWELNPVKPELIPVFSRGYGAIVRKYKLKPKKFDNGIVGYVASVGYPYIARNLEDDPHYLPGLKDARSSVTVPLKVANQVFGVLNIESREKSAFDMADVTLLKEYAGYVAVALNIRTLLDMGEKITVNRISKTLAHEVNNPLEAIFMSLSSVDAKEEKLSDNMIETLRIINQNLNLINSAVQKLSSLDTIEIDEEYEIIDVEDNLSGRNILVIEDDNEVRNSMRTMLESEGCMVDEAPDGKKGIALVKNKNYEVIITDIKMPAYNGYEVFKKIRRFKPEQKIVMMTGFGYDESHTIVKCNEEGLNGVLYKPFTPDLLKKVLTRVCT